MAKYKIIEEALEKEKKIVIEALQKELNFQKHVAKGTLRNGFYHKIVNSPDKISLYIMNNTPYMWTVNDGKSSGVNATYQAIADWTFHKETNGELTFGSEHQRNNFISTVKHRLEKKYLTAGGDLVAPRRYFFIDFVRKSWKNGAVKRIKDAIVKDVEDIVNKELIKKEIKLTIA